MGSSGRGVVVPFPKRDGTKEDLWEAQRLWVHAGRRTRRLASYAVEELGRIERDLQSLETALGEEHPDPARLQSFARGELSREENRSLVRHLMTGCTRCAGVLRPLLGMAGLPLLRPERRKP